MAKVRTAIIGSGNIGTDLMFKLFRSPLLAPVLMVGIDPASEGLALAKERGLAISAEGIQGLAACAEAVDVVFDATSAKAHLEHATILKKLNKLVIDLTPAAVGPYVVPAVNIADTQMADNVNMVTCGGQATVPMVKAVSRIVPVSYAEIVATVASKSAGPGTRANIDEFTETTALAVEKLGGARSGKAIIILNPAEPPVMMRNTVRCIMENADKATIKAVRDSISAMVKDVQQYVPGYRLKHEPLFEDQVVTLFVEVEGLGDYLPPYAGNLDIITCAAVKTAEKIASTRYRELIEEHD